MLSWHREKRRTKLYAPSSRRQDLPAHPKTQHLFPYYVRVKGQACDGPPQPSIPRSSVALNRFGLFAMPTS